MNILLADDDPTFHDTLARLVTTLCGKGVRIDRVHPGYDPARLAAACSYDLCFVGPQAGVEAAFELLDRMGRASPRTAMIFVADQGRRDWAYGALTRGAADYLVKDQVEEFDLLKTIAFALYRKARETELQGAALRDALTGIGNRQLFNEQVNALILNAKRAQESAAVLFMDVDGMKTVNDTYGHAAGDALLQQVARRITAQMRESDVVARVGGDEFAAILMRVSRRAEIIRIEENLNQAITRTPFQVGPVTLRVGLSCGAAIYPDECDDIPGLIALADQRMYEVKRGQKALVAAAASTEGGVYFWADGSWNHRAPAAAVGSAKVIPRH